MSSLTKIFIVLQLVFSVALSVLVIMVVSSQPKYKEQLEAQAKTAIAFQAAAIKDADQAFRYAQVIDKLNERIATLSKDYGDKLADKATKISDLERDSARLNAVVTALTGTNGGQASLIATFNDQYGKVYQALATAQKSLQEQQVRTGQLEQANSRLTQERDLLAKALRRAQEEVVALNDQLEQARKAAPGAGASPVDAGRVGTGVVVNPVAAVNGPITRVDARDGKIFFSMPLGKRDGVQNGTTMIISRDNTYIGDAVVVNATVAESVATVKVVVQGQAVKAGDIVTIGR